MSEEEKHDKSPEEETKPEEEEVREPPKVYNCACHYCDDDSVVPATINCVVPNFFAMTLQPSGDIQPLEITDLREKWLVLFTFPMVATTVAPSEIVAFSENHSRFAEINCEILALTNENVFTINAWTRRPRVQGGIGPVSFAIAADPARDISHRYGLDSPNEKGLFLINPEGVLKHVDINTVSVTRSVEETLRLVKAYQFAAEHGEVCPAQWKEGEPTIKPKVTEAKKFFERNY